LQTTYSSSNNQISYVTVNGVNTTYTYDAAGNLLNDGTYSYQWDAEGRLATVTLSGNVVSMNTYNALGQRVEDVTQSSTTEEAYGAGGALLARYTGDSNSRSFVPFNGGLLAEYYCGGVIFDHPDELGSATTATDCTGKNVQERLYYPFGESWTGAGSLGMHQEFAQLPDYDPETDQYNTPNRHYTPMGRWLTPDPSGVKAVRLDDPQTWNMYAYVRNNPTTLTDPAGLYVCGSTMSQSQCDTFQSLLDQAQVDVNKLKGMYGPDSSQYLDAQRAIDSYGGEGVANGVTVNIGATGGYPASTFAQQSPIETALNPTGQDIEVTLRGDLMGTATNADLVDTVAHEGSHVADAEDWAKAGFTGEAQPTNLQTELRAYGVGSSLAAAQGRIWQVANSPEQPNIKFPFWMRNYSQGVNNMLSTGMIKALYPNWAHKAWQEETQGGGQ
jgi:RHS repeat-associated protein